MAKSGVFKIWLVAIANPQSFQYNCWGEGTGYAVGMKLKSMFDQVSQHPSSTFASSDYFYNVGNVQDTDVVVYLFGDFKPGTSFIHKKAGWRNTQAHRAEHLVREME